MNDVVIRVDGLGKRYRIGARQASYRTLRETIVDLAAAPMRRLKSVLRGQASTEARETIWALKDVSFDVRQGEAVGIIGRNGAGKTTLLKILSRITKPTQGRVSLVGRVGSLLEVGTGFHPELTGRENIFLNGAILGMRRVEIERKFDEIVAFAGIERFVDTPVKHYSSGMYVRLAFSVAAHLEPDILLIDEVLSVGDASFQKKCLGRMKEVTYEGRTVLYVSHNLPSVLRLCQKAIWIDQGEVCRLGDPYDIVNSYLASDLSDQEGFVIFDEPDIEKEAYIYSVTLNNAGGKATSRFDISSPIRIQILFKCLKTFSNWRLFTSIARYDGEIIFSTTTSDYKDPELIAPGTYQATVEIPSNFLAAGNYLISLSWGEPPYRQHDIRENVLTFEVVGSAYRLPRLIGFLEYPFIWEIEHIAS